ncbi:MAG: hypothetical protein JWM53_3780, partial [bacterium]|nr:hypothetical protein [bacterium]
MPEPEPERSADQRADARVAAKRPRVARFALVVEIALVAVFVLGGTTLRLRIAHPQWVFAGSDSYGYLKIADEWRRDHRFAFGPPPQPLQWYRRPLYPLFLVVARGDARAEMDGGPGWRRIELAQLALELLLMWPLLYVACRRVGGRLAALVALALATLYPPAVVFPLAALTESLAMTLTV